jgi:hypothetical protein
MNIGRKEAHGLSMVANWVTGLGFTLLLFVERSSPFPLKYPILGMASCFAISVIVYIATWQRLPKSKRAFDDDFFSFVWYGLKRYWPWFASFWLITLMSISIPMSLGIDDEASFKTGYNYLSAQKEVKDLAGNIYDHSFFMSLSRTTGGVNDSTYEEASYSMKLFGDKGTANAIVYVSCPERGACEVLEYKVYP